MSNIGDQTVDLDGNSLYFSSSYNDYVRANKFCSEEFYCEQCLTKNNELVKGKHRYDSLVLCEFHNEEFKPIMNKLRAVFDNCHCCTVIRNLGL